MRIDKWIKNSNQKSWEKGPFGILRRRWEGILKWIVEGYDMD